MDTFLENHDLSDCGGNLRKLKAWLHRAQPGDTFVYHCGFLALGTNQRGDVLAPLERQRLAGVAQRAWSAAAEGRVHLLQRRLAENCFEYFAVARAQSIEPGAMRREVAIPVLG